MTWVKLDDGFPTHPKVIGLSDRAFRAYVLGLCYASQHLTDGHVPAEYVRTREAEELVRHGLWLPRDAGSGWLIRDYLEYNPSREKTLTERRRAAERRAKGGRTSDDVRPAHDRPDPSPTPPPETKGETLAPTARKRDPGFDALAELDGGPDGMTTVALKRVGVKLAEIRSAAPGVSPDEIRRRSANLALLFPQARPTAASLASHWSQCDRTPSTNGKRDPAAEILRGAVNDGFDPSQSGDRPAARVLPGA